MLLVLCPRVFLAAILACVFVHHTIQANCPSGWKNFGDSCYKLLDEKLSWDEASRVCDRPEGSLAVPNNLAENRFIHEFQDDCQMISCGLWIGCKFEGHNLTCSGQTHTPLLANLADKAHTESHECVIMSKGNGGKWQKKTCTEEKNVVCEIPNQIRMYCLAMDARHGFSKQKCLHGHVIKNITARGVSDCGAACWAEPRCRSFNLRQQGGPHKICQLNNATILESEEDGFYDDACNYFGL